MRVIDGVIGAVWAIFWAYWLVSAFGAKASRRTSRGFVGARVAIALVVVGLIRGGVLGKHAVSHSEILGLVGLAAVICGLGFAVWARLHIGRNWGMPMTRRVAPELVTTGPYRLVRHPIYTGIILAMIGTAIAVGIYALIPALVLAGYFVYSARSEERFLIAEFPDAYPQYRRSTKMLIPYLF